MFGFFKRIFSTQSQRDIKKLRPIVEKINKIYGSLAVLTHDELRAETDKLRTFIETNTKSVAEKVSKLKEEAEATQDLKKQFTLFASIDKWEKKYNEKIESILLEMLPRAFAIVKETARRFKEHRELVVQATGFDKALAEKYDHLVIQGDKAHWHNRWLVRGEEITWNMVHFDVQLMGGIVLHQGKVAEMKTGEGKTVAAIPPAFLNALAKKGVHIFTVNDYLAQRDAEWMGPIFQFHGMRVACIEGTPIKSQERREAYNADITYGTNSGFAFDYLYDNIATSKDQQVQRSHHYAIIDELDCALIDNALTPFIVSGSAQVDNHKLYRNLKPRVKQMYQAQQHLVTAFLKEAKEKIGTKAQKEGALSLFRAYRGLPTYWPLITYLSEKGIKRILADTENDYLRENAQAMPEADAPLYFTIDKKTNTIDITDKGIEYLTKKDEASHFFILPDIGTQVAEIEKDHTCTDEEKIARKKALFEEFSTKSSRIHTVTQLLKAYTLYKKNQEYVVMEGEVKIVDEKTGRILRGRRYSDGLHQALEAKEDVRIAKPTQTYASITPPNQFRMYHKISGMTGTAATEATELLEIYNLEVVIIPTNKKVIRKDFPDRLYKTKREKMQAIAEIVQKIHKTHRPILIITPDVETSEYIRKLLNIAPTRVLNAKNHLLEATIIATAGELDAITLATQMAGRGTDIKVTPEAEALGGLCVIMVEKHETRRVDNQARGRAGRQGQKGSSMCFLSLEDPLVVHWSHGALGRQVDRIWGKEGEVLIDNTINKLITSVQKNKEQNHFFSRKRTLEYDNVMDKQRKVIYRWRKHALTRKRLDFDIMYAVYSTIKDIVLQKTNAEERRKEHTILTLVEVLNLQRSMIAEAMKHAPDVAIKKIYQQATKQRIQKEEAFVADLYEKLKKVKGLKHAIVPLACNEEIIPLDLDIPAMMESQGKSAIGLIHSALTLHVLDQLWIKHLQRMDHLKDSVRTAHYEQKDPLLVYKFEGVKIFKELIHTINRTITHYLLHFKVAVDAITLQQEGLLPKQWEDLQASKDDTEGAVMEHGSKPAPVITAKTFNRNERVTVRYADGTTKKNIKYKTVADDIEKGSCTLVAA